MVKRCLLSALIVSILVTACAVPTESNLVEAPERSTTAPIDEQPSLPTSTSKPQPVETDQPEREETEVVVTVEAECPGEGTNAIGQGIADEYEFTSYDEVITWFCDGAEFEDIMVALQTEELSDTPAEEMLVMLAEGFTWEDIWLVVGLTE